MASGQNIFSRADVSRGTLERLDRFIGLLHEWQRRINLIASPKDIAIESFREMVWRRHVEDSLQLVPYVQADRTIIDIGSGGGFPSLILSFVLDNEIVLVESDKRKCEFLKEAIRKFDLKSRVSNQRIEALKSDDFNNDITITSRACASVSKLLELTHQFHSRADYLLLKGEKARLELDEASRLWHMDYQLYPSITDPQASIIHMCGIKNHDS